MTHTLRRSPSEFTKVWRSAKVIPKEKPRFGGSSLRPLIRLRKCVPVPGPCTAAGNDLKAKTPKLFFCRRHMKSRPPNPIVLKCFSTITFELDFFLDVGISEMMRTFLNFIGCILEMSKCYENNVTEVIPLHMSLSYLFRIFL